MISIHALREESDGRLVVWPRLTIHFNPRPPRGERLFGYLCSEQLFRISIHALREESDLYLLTGIESA